MFKDAIIVTLITLILLCLILLVSVESCHAAVKEENLDKHSHISIFFDTCAFKSCEKFGGDAWCQSTEGVGFKVSFNLTGLDNPYAREAFYRCMGNYKSLVCERPYNHEYIAQRQDCLARLYNHDFALKKYTNEI